MTRKELEALLGDVAAQNIKTTDAASLIGGALHAARAPWLAVTFVGVALAAVLGVGVQGCLDARRAEAAKACSCPPPSCDAVWERARRHHAREMLRGLRLKSYNLEDER